MLFSSIPFLFYFLPAVLALYFLVPKNLKNAVLLLFSLVFYAWGEPVYVFLMIGTIALFFFCGVAIGKSKTQRGKKLWLTVSVVVSLTLLAIFKYADFLVGNVNSLLGTNIPLLELALPIGISFYTFQCLSYTIDVYRGNAQVQKNIVSFGAYVSLFPQLIAGPIVRYVDVARELDNRTHSWENIRLGLRRFLIGLGKKILIANQFGELTNLFRDSGEKSVVFYWIYAVAFALHIYFDFSGYSDMAIGLGRVFGFHFIENFNYPYLSRSVAEFWRRWHMSLGSWFRDYVYIPLGGNRVSRGRWVFNTLVVWMLTGLWHGAAWNFVLWGLLYAVCLLIEKFVPALQKLPDILRRGYTLLVVVLGFVLFNAADLAQAVSDIGGMFGFGNVPFVSPETLYFLRSYALLFAVALVGATPAVKQLAGRLEGKGIGLVLETVLILALLLVCTAYLVDGSFNPFLYFRF
ncbi:MAG: MBOAT family protein [Oscillospiraceae bacterium]|nr:MBOAT family protein [Oscillospiraceae bacterium]